MSNPPYCWSSKRDQEVITMLHTQYTLFRPYTSRLCKPDTFTLYVELWGLLTEYEDYRGMLWIVLLI